MLEVVQGVPGSGKSYYAVKKLLEAQSKLHYTITNIDGCTFVDEFIDAQIGKEISEFILGRNWEEFAQSIDGKKIYLVIDEAQRVYPYSGMDRKTQQELLYFLEYHRHYGMDITLVTQSKNSLSSRVIPLMHQICVVSKVSLAGKQRVKTHDPTTWELITTESFKREQKVFDSYVSASVDSGHQKPVNPLKRIFSLGIIVLILLISALSVLYYIVSNFISDNDTPPLETQNEELATIKPQAIAKPIQEVVSTNYDEIYKWYLPDYELFINSERCSRPSHGFSWHCPNLPYHRIVQSLANVSVCSDKRCDYFFEDSNYIQSIRNIENAKPSQAFRLPSSLSDFAPANPFSRSATQ